MGQSATGGGDRQRIISLSGRGAGGNAQCARAGGGDGRGTKGSSRADRQSADGERDGAGKASAGGDSSGERGLAALHHGLRGGRGGKREVGPHVNGAGRGIGVGKTGVVGDCKGGDVGTRSGVSDAAWIGKAAEVGIAAGERPVVGADGAVGIAAAAGIGDGLAGGDGDVRGRTGDGAGRWHIVSRRNLNHCGDGRNAGIVENEEHVVARGSDVATRWASDIEETCT